ncbi:hypothetical protein LZ009_09565 [Ramlibacter sp. XY19]|uniref:hypothetical protein n=1 Tax=Ramlibacter paludis TaxID=2908000 RepID=UPI0023DA08C9|nr:hypothetical protein [Ramlibacter paludis]MCG2593028.1 hypothetical protein [Ramlibacter paludis]
MFVTMPHFEQFMPGNLVGPGHQSWRAVTLSVESPWYLFVYEAKYGQQKVPQTTLVAWEDTLLAILEGIPADDRKGVARVEKERRPGTRWHVTWIETIWAPAPEEVQETGLFLLQLEGDPLVRDAHLRPVDVREGRALVYSALPNAVAQPTSRGPVDVPDDFPVPVPPGVVPGSQPKLGIREEKGRFTSDGVVARAERHDICQDLVNQLVAYAENKRLEKPDTEVSRLVSQVLAQVHKKQFGWGLSPAESAWIAGRVKAHFDVQR